MKLLCVAPLLLLTHATRSGFLLRSSGVVKNIVTGANDKAVDQSTMRNEVTKMVADMIAGKGPEIAEVARAVHNKIDLSTAVRELDGKLPSDVASLVRVSAKGAKKAAFDEQSLQKARKILNTMLTDAWAELDDVVFECKEFQERNRGTFEQVVADLARLGSQLSRLGELRVDASQGITDMDRERKDADENLEKLTSQFTENRFENSREMTVRKNDLAVFDFILQATACKDFLFMQMGEPAGVQVCQTATGPTLNFKNPELQQRLERLMTPEATLALREALGQVEKPLGLLQEMQPSNDTTTALPTFAAEVVP